MTGQELLDRMELLNQELQLQTGEADVTRGLLALNVAQDYFESQAARRPKLFGSNVGTVATSNGVETTAFPDGLIRVDRLQLIENSLPVYDLLPVKNTGGHRWSSRWPLYLFTSSVQGKPTHYWTNGRSFYWNPIPSGTHTIRYYGFVAASELTTGTTFQYADIAALPIAAFAVKVLKIGIDDDASSLDALAANTFGPTLDTLERGNRDGAAALEYTRNHTE